MQLFIRSVHTCSLSDMTVNRGLVFNTEPPPVSRQTQKRNSPVLVNAKQTAGLTQ